MNNAIKASILASAVLAFASIGAYAQPPSNSTTATVQLQATVSSWDNITCQPTVDLGGGMPIANQGPTTPQPVSCNVTSNDINPISLTAYILDSAPLTGINAHFQISNFQVSAGPSPFSLMSFQPILVNGLSGNDGVVVQNFVPQGLNMNSTFFMSLFVPFNTPADTYQAILTVAITPNVG
jgi:hypothetical protein